MGAKGKGSEAGELLALWRETGDATARDRLVAEHLPLVRRICRRFSYLGEPMDDLVQVGAIGLLKAIHKYDPDRGSVLAAFAIPVIVGELKNYFRDHGWAVKMPRKLQQQKLAVDRMVATLSQTLGRSPTVPEIAEATGLCQEQVYETFVLERIGRPLSLDAAYDCDDDGGEEPATILDYLGRESPELEGLAENLDLVSALQRLDPRDQAIIRLKFCFELSQAEIGERLGISQMHVSRLQRNALNKLKTALLGQSWGGDCTQFLELPPPPDSSLRSE